MLLALPCSLAQFGAKEGALNPLQDLGGSRDSHLFNFTTALEKYDGCSLMPSRPDRQPSLMVMVLSACGNVGRRGLVRTMMKRAEFTNYKFLLGNCTGADEERGDLVHVNTTDTYYTSSTKMMLGMEVMLQRRDFDFEWLMKMDDDVLVQFTPLLQGLALMPRLLCRNDGGTGGSGIGSSELPLWWGAFRRGYPYGGGRNAVNVTTVQPHLVDGQWRLYGFGSGHVMNRAAVQQIVQAKDQWAGFAERSGIWMEDVAFGVWFDSLEQSCRLHDPEFTQYCGDENVIAEVDGLVRNPADYCAIPSWTDKKHGDVPSELGTVICGTTSEAISVYHAVIERKKLEDDERLHVYQHGSMELRQQMDNEDHEAQQREDEETAAAQARRKRLDEEAHEANVAETARLQQQWVTQ